MKKIIVFLTFAVLFTLTIPALAANQTPTGEWIWLGPDGATLHFDEYEAFHIRHGWYARLIPGEEKPDMDKFAKAGFALELDGAFLEEDYVDREIRFEEGETLFYEYTYFNFPDGMTGTHTFTGHWHIACKYIQDECENPNEILDYMTRTVTIIFDR